MLRAALFGCATALLAACPSPRGVAHEHERPSGDDRAIRIRIAKLEAAREHGQVELAQLVRDGEADTTTLALRGLARVDSPDAGRALVAYAGGADGAAAVSALGLASALLEPPADVTTLRTDALLAAYRSDAPGVANQRAVILEALGHAGDARALPALTSALAAPDVRVAATAGIALGWFGRRKIALDGPARTALIAATRDRASAVRYAATYALRTEASPPADPHGDPVIAALVARVADDDPETRAQAIVGLTRRSATDVARPALERALGDRDWRVVVEAVRALAGEHGDAGGRAAVIAAVPAWVAAIPTAPTAAHPAIEALQALAAAAEVSPGLAPMLHGLVVPPAAPPMVRAWLACLVAAGQARAGEVPLAEVARCGGGALPDPLRLPLVAELLSHRAGDPAARRAALGALLGATDARVRGAALGVLAAVWPEGTAEDHAATLATVTAAFADPDPSVAGAAVQALPALTPLATPAQRAELEAAAIARATKESDPDLASALLGWLGTAKVAAGADACRVALAGTPVRRRAGEACLRALGVPVPEAAEPPAPAIPPVAIDEVIGATVRWHLVTTRGEIVIALRPEVAPWGVATIVGLTRKGFYDHTEVHRVVPGFVAQGGDPTGTGYGGPGYALPAEPATFAEGPGFVTGGVGLADSGPDTAGSQWFIMQGRAAHLDGRYTWVGSVETGQAVADSLVVGDRVERATVEVTQNHN